MVAAIATWVSNTAATLATNAGASAAVTATVKAVAYYGTQIAITTAASAALRAAQGTPDADAVKGSKKQPIPPRIRAYGYRKLGGYYLLWEAKNNYAYDVVYFAEGPCQGGPNEQVWSHDHVLLVNPSTGWVAGSPEYGGGSGDLIHVETRRGLPTETSYAAITAGIGSSVWPAAARGDGLSTLGADYHHAKQENLLDDFPQRDPSWSKTSHWSLIWDPRDPAQSRTDWTTWTGAHANIGLQILDFCCHPTGMAMDYETEIAPALEHWKGEFDICDEDVPLASGATEKRYWGSSFYAVPADPQEHLDRLLAACDGKLLKDQHGVWRLWVGKYRAPTVHLEDLDIAGHDLSGDAAAFDLANEIVPKFVDPEKNWTMVDTPEWRDQDEVDRIGGKVMSQPLALEACNSRTMARRIGKAVLRRNGSPLRGSITGRLSAAEALGQRWISADLPDLGLSGLVLEMEDGGKLAFSRAAVDLTVTQADPLAYDWTTAEEGETQVVGRVPVIPLEPPTIDGIEPVFESLGGTDGIRLAVEGTGPDRDDLTWFTRWRVAGTTSWSTEEITDDAAGPPFSGLTGFVSGESDLEVQLGFKTGQSAIQWSDIAEAGPYSINYRVTTSGAERVTTDGARRVMTG